MYAISLYRYGVCIAVVGGKLIFLSSRPRDYWRSVPQHCFAVEARTVVIFSTIAALLGVWERFLLMGVSFPLPFL